MTECPLNILVVGSDHDVLCGDRDLLEVEGDNVFVCLDFRQVKSVLGKVKIDLILAGDDTILDGEPRIPTVVLTEDLGCLDEDQIDGLVKRVKVEKLFEISRIAHDFVNRIRGQ